MRLSHVALAGFTLAALASLPAAGQEEQTNVTMKDRSHEAMAAAMAAAPGVKFENVQLDLDGGQATYELSGTGSEGRKVEVDVLADGEVLEVEHEIGMDEVPQQVQQVLGRYLSGFQPTLIERSTRGSLATWYEFEGQGQQGEIDIEVSEDGGQILIAQDAAA